MANTPQAEVELNVRKGAIEKELSGIKPILDAAKKSVGQISSDNLNEIRSLKMPPEPIRDVLSAVLMLLGINDTSWLSMRNFLGQWHALIWLSWPAPQASVARRSDLTAMAGTAGQCLARRSDLTVMAGTAGRRGVKSMILDYDVSRITKPIRKSVGKLLKKQSSSFDEKRIRRVSVAAAPLASWVKANIKYSVVLEKVKPLSDELERANTQSSSGPTRSSVSRASASRATRRSSR